MKKLISVAIAGVAAAACAFAFTACGGDDDKNQETSYTVTEAEWKSAITSVYDCKQGVEANSKFVGGEADGCNYIYRYDNVNKSISLHIKEDPDDYYCYLWQNEGKYYDYLLSDEATTQISKETYDDELQMLVVSYTGNGLPYALIEDNDSFKNATYDEANKAYKGSSVQSEGHEAVKFNFTLKFENKKLVKLIGELLKEDNQTVHMTITVEYKYDNITVTIPDDIKNMPVTE